MSSVYSESEEYPPDDSTSYYYPSYSEHPQDPAWSTPSTSQCYWEGAALESSLPPTSDAEEKGFRESSYGTVDTSYPSWEYPSYDYPSYGHYSDDSYNEHYGTYYPQYDYSNEDADAREAAIPHDTIATNEIETVGEEDLLRPETSDDASLAPCHPEITAQEARGVNEGQLLISTTGVLRDEDCGSDVSTNPRPEEEDSLASGDASSVNGDVCRAVQQPDDIAFSSADVSVEEECVSVETGALSSAPSVEGVRKASDESHDESQSLVRQRRPTSSWKPASSKRTGTKGTAPTESLALALPLPPSRRRPRCERPRGRCEDRRRRPLLRRGTSSSRRPKATSLAEAAALAAAAISQHLHTTSGSSGSEDLSSSPLRCSSVQRDPQERWHQPPSRHKEVATAAALQSPREEAEMKKNKKKKKDPPPSPTWATASDAAQRFEEQDEDERLSDARAGRAVARSTVKVAAQAAARAVQGDGDAARWRRAASWIVRCSVFSTSESEMGEDDDEQEEKDQRSACRPPSPPLSPGATCRVLAASSHEERLRRALAESQKARGLTPWTWEALVGPEPRTLAANCSLVPAPSLEERRRFRRSLFASAPPRGWKVVATQVKRQVRRASERSLARLQIDAKTKAAAPPVPPPPAHPHHVLGEPTLLDEICQEAEAGRAKEQVTRNSRPNTREVALQTGEGDKEYAQRNGKQAKCKKTKEKDKLPISVKLSPRYIFRPIEELKSTVTEDESESDTNFHADDARDQMDRGERPRLARKGSAVAQQIAKESLGYTPLMNADLTQTIRKLSEEARDMRSLSPVSWTSSESSEAEGDDAAAVGTWGRKTRRSGSGKAATVASQHKALSRPQGVKNPVPMATALRAAARRQAAIDKRKKQKEVAEEQMATTTLSTPPEKESIPVTPAVKDETSGAGDTEGESSIDRRIAMADTDNIHVTSRASSGSAGPGSASASSPLLRLPPIAAERRAPLASLRRVRSIFECELSSPRRGRASPPFAPPPTVNLTSPPAPPRHKTTGQRLQPLTPAPLPLGGRRASTWRGKGVGAAAPLPAIGTGGGRRNHLAAPPPTGAGDGTTARVPNKRVLLRPPFR